MSGLGVVYRERVGVATIRSRRPGNAARETFPHTTIIAPEKLRDYVLNPTNPDGEPKARFLGEMGYDQRNWRILEVDLRTQHLSQDVQPGKSSMYGKKYEIIAPLVGPNGNTLLTAVDLDAANGEPVARFVPLIPEKQP